MPVSRNRIPWRHLGKHGQFKYCDYRTSTTTSIVAERSEISKARQTKIDCEVVLERSAATDEVFFIFVQDRSLGVWRIRNSFRLAGTKLTEGRAREIYAFGGPSAEKHKSPTSLTTTKMVIRFLTCAPYSREKRAR